MGKKCVKTALKVQKREFKIWQQYEHLFFLLILRRENNQYIKV